MIRELRRFAVQDAVGVAYTLAEVALFINIDGREVMDGVPTLFSSLGFNAMPTGRPGEYHIPRLQLTVHEVA